MASALLLMMSAGQAFAGQTVDPPVPTVEGAQLSARPGERLTFTVASYLVGMNGYQVASEIFVQHGTLRMNDSAITAVATVACDTAPGVYPVEMTGPGGPTEGVKGNTWVTVKVADIGEAERRACPGKVSALPPEQLEERWPASASWPQSPWDVRTFRPGERRTLESSDAQIGHGDTLTSPGFTDRAVMHGAKGMTATATIRCDAEPGLYEVRWVGDDEVWARYRVTSAVPGCQDPTTGAAWRTTPWLLGGAVALAAVGTAGYVFLRRHRKTA
ncbi:hypothetical protein [Streptomyces sp. NPDC002602]|uniref:hypothetical protein n=1 Tax=Streptomyces sp. NPDC002602 TaxID=3364654 RepID=UPI0036C869B7